MKRLIIILLPLVIGLCTPLLGQTNPTPRLILNAGAGFPVGDFAGEGTATSGWAATGWCAGIEFLYPVSDIIAVGPRIDVNRNNLDHDKLLSEIRSTSVSADPYTIVSVLLDSRFTLPLPLFVPPELSLFAGYVHNELPTITSSSARSNSQSLGGDGSGFAYGFGLGVGIAGLDITGRYMSAQPEYTLGGQGREMHQTRPIGLIEATIGYSIGL